MIKGIKSVFQIKKKILVASKLLICFSDKRWCDALRAIFTS